LSSGTTYRIWWNDSYDGDGRKTADIDITAYDNTGNQLFDDDSGWNYPQLITPSSNGKIYLGVRLWDNPGTFAIVYSTNSARP